MRIRDGFCDETGIVQPGWLFFLCLHHWDLKEKKETCSFLNRRHCSVYVCTRIYVFNRQLLSDLKSEIDKLATEYISNARTLSSEEKLGLLKQIQEAYGKCKEFGDDKVQLAMQTYEMV